MNWEDWERGAWVQGGGEPGARGAPSAAIPGERGELGPKGDESHHFPL